MTVTLRFFMPYGAPDLQEAAARHMVRALSLGSFLAITMFALAWLLTLMLVHPAAPVKPIRVQVVEIAQRYDVLRPPPPISTPPVVRPASSKAVDAVPTPVEDAPENVERTIASQGETSVAPSSGEAGNIVSGGDPVEAPPPIDRYVWTDVLPDPITEIQPVYPPFAQSLGVEGLVLVHVLVGKDGRVMEARLDAREHVLLLDEAALEAARKWVFTPALASGHPVMVWATIPFRFKLH